MKAGLILLALFAGGAGVKLVEGGRNVSERDLLRGYGLAACLEAGYKGTAFEKDAARVAELYREVGHTTRPTVYEAIDRAAKAAEPSKPAATDGANLSIMSCLEFYEGRALGKVVEEAGGAKGR